MPSSGYFGVCCVFCQACIFLCENYGVMCLCRTCLELIQALLHLSEVGHFEAVSTVFQSGPVLSCPDILLLSMLQARVNSHLLQDVFLWGVIFLTL